MDIGTIVLKCLLGWLGVFVVTLVIIVVIQLLNIITLAAQRRKRK